MIVREWVCNFALVYHALIYHCTIRCYLIHYARIFYEVIGLANEVKKAVGTIDGVDYVAKMARVIKQEQKKGLVGLRFCYLPQSSRLDNDEMGQVMAKAFCELEELDRKNQLTIV